MRALKKIKIAFSGLLEAYGDVEELLIYRVLKKYYDVEVVNNPENAEYLIVGPFKPYEYCKYNQIRIMYCGENYIPDLNFIDYGISSYPITLQDRCFRLPVCVDQFGHCESLQRKNRQYNRKWLSEKKYFANFIVGHDSEDHIRGDFFKRLEKYKRVESPGRFLNNMDNGYLVKWTDSSKIDFQKKCKFTICFESTAHEGFITEKITDAFLADTIPIYYGSSDVTGIFNKNAFIQCKGREDFENTISKIIELDQNDEKYLEMMNQPVFVTQNYVDELMIDFEQFVKHIFDQPIEKAYRRSKVYAPKYHEEYVAYLIKKAQEYDCFTLKKLIRRKFKSIKKEVVRKSSVLYLRNK